MQVLYYIKVLKFLSNISGVKGTFFSIKIILVGFKFALTLFLICDQPCRGTLYVVEFFSVAFRSSYLIQSISGFQSTIVSRIYFRKINKQIN